MSIDFRVTRRVGLRLASSLALTAIVTAGGAKECVAAKVRVGPETEVRSIRFVGVQSLSEKRLRELLRTRDRGAAYGLRSALAKLPFVSSPAPQRFRPRGLQEDVVRLRDAYFAAGFWGTQVNYDVQLVDEQEQLLDIVFIIEEGTPQRVVGVNIVSADSAAVLPIPPEERGSWHHVEQEAHGLVGHRLDVVDARSQRDRLAAWWRDRGFPRASAIGRVERDSVRHEGRIQFVVAVGPRQRFGPISVEGNQNISDRVVRRELPFQSGDLYSERALVEGQRELQQLEILRTSRLEVLAADPASAAVDSVLPVEVTVSEAKPRLIAGQLGYVTDAGLSSETRWSHRNFTGGARVLTVSGLTQTGLLAVTSDPDVRYRGVVSLQQPYAFHRRLSAVVSPFVQYRKDLGERSLEVGSNFTLVYRRSHLLSLALDYRISTRDIYEYRLGELTGGNVDLLTFLSQIFQGELGRGGGRVQGSLVTLSASASTLDDFANPRRGLLVRPSLQVTAPTGWSSAGYWKSDGSVYGFVPLTRRSVLATRLTAGRLFPFGKSVSAPDRIAAGFLGLRDASFTAGGGADVRGWSYGMLGPKLPDLRVTEQADTLVVAPAGAYVPLGGLSRLSFTLEVRLPLPALGPKFGSHVFLDGGRVWTDDSRFRLSADTLDQERIFYAAGAGLDLLTPVGAIKVSLGYKLNPSLLDLVDADDYTRAVLDGTPAEQLEKRGLRRWQLHLSFGTSY